ncbi:MAG: hypothetical protein ACREIV_05160, partial [Planctomycetaceae bacterium]
IVYNAVATETAEALHQRFLTHAPVARGRELMHPGDLREALHRVPFVPFRIRLADGRELPVPHPDVVAVGDRRIVVVNADDTTMFLEPLLIVSLDFQPEPSRPGGQDGNGSTSASSD